MLQLLLIAGWPMHEGKQWVWRIKRKVWTSLLAPSLAHLVGHRKEVEIGKVSGNNLLQQLKRLYRNTKALDSPDPVLTGIMIAETIKGIQSTGVMACAKHYIANEQEHFRQAPEAAGFGATIGDSLSSNIDDVTMHETYLWYVVADIS